MHERRNHLERFPGGVMAFSDSPSPLSSPAPPSANTVDVTRVVKRLHLLCIRRGEIGRLTTLWKCGGLGWDHYRPSPCLAADALFQDDEAAPVAADADPSAVVAGCCATAAAAHLRWVAGFVLLVEDTSVYVYYSEVVFGCFLAGFFKKESPPPP
ncbi:unnamed protein product [Lactuca virosa]|uniref:Uncharacterized protein n=1 Tax=Lactuca virosa TaxID=75947 RepID=A0AAU9PM06_9ASTR|nr:unnamed protein product [Lactuca virosa]